MKIIRTVPDMQQAALDLKRAGKRIGFVPTMGFLHEGHLSLVRIAHERTDAVVVSIFVNPTQFGPGEDLGRYPRDFERDEELCRGEGVDLVFYPPQDEMYAVDHSVYVVEELVTRELEGRHRPLHFRGVLTVVAKLFNAALPDLAVFGRKDAQQLCAVQRMVRDLDFPVEIEAGPIVREPDGLAMSSRNKYLSEDERRDALCLRRALDTAEKLYAKGERASRVIQQAMTDIIEPVASARIDYAEIVDEDTFKPIATISSRALAALAVRVGATRLIDNTVLGESS